jgi:hypothetical protein
MPGTLPAKRFLKSPATSTLERSRWEDGDKDILNSPSEPASARHPEAPTLTTEAVVSGTAA